ncbi:MAG: ABC transporter permease subunit [Anaerolineae bacterium]|nr:ABC transporter permease subunit [Anaerolineae bacterium]
MVSLFRAEWSKIAGNRIVLGVFIWIFPVTALVLLIFAAISAAASEEFRLAITAAPPTWTGQAFSAWGFINTEIGRFMLVGFAADVFGGECQRQMWKNLLPRRRRLPLILNKFLAIAVYALTAFIAMVIIVTVMSGVVAAAAGAPYGPALADMDASAWTQFLTTFGSQASIAFAAAIIAACYAAVGAILTRSILGAIVIGAFLTLLEQGIALALGIFVGISQQVGAFHLYLYTPGYNLANLSSWSTYGNGYMPIFIERYNCCSPFSAETSTVLVLVWIVGLIALTSYLFMRQDISH